MFLGFLSRWKGYNNFEWLWYHAYIYIYIYIFFFFCLSMYCEHFLPAVYWSLMTWAARWSNVLGAEELLLLAFSSTTRGASIFCHLWGGDFLTPFFLQFCWYTPRGLPEWLNLLSREVHDPFGETKLCALGLQAHQCLKMLISLGVGDYEVVRMSMAKWCQICVLLFVMFVTDSLRFQEVNLLKPTMMLMPCKANTTNSTAPWPWPRATNLFGRDGYWTVYWFMDRNERTENQWTSYDIYIHIIHIRIRRVHSSPFISLGNIWYLPCLGVVFSTLTVLEPVLHWIKDPFLQKRENMHRLNGLKLEANITESGSLPM